MPRSHLHGSPRRFYYGLNFTDDPENVNFSSSIWMHNIRMIKYYYVWLRMQYGKLWTNKDCHKWCRIVSVANPASSPLMCDLGISERNCAVYRKGTSWGPFNFVRYWNCPLLINPLNISIGQEFMSLKERICSQKKRIHSFKSSSLWYWKSFLPYCVTSLEYYHFY